MRRFAHTVLRLGAATAVLMTAFLANGQAAQAAPVAAGLPTATCTLSGTTRSCELWAKPGTINLPGAANTPILGYTTSAAGAAQLPGPAIIANEGETLIITLHNGLSSATSLAVPAIDGPPDLSGVAAGAAKTYTFSSLAPGTYSYEAGVTIGGARQVAMGLFGGLVVRPVGQPNRAYGAGSDFNDEALLVYSEIDPLFNAAPATFAMSDFHPQYWLINGLVAPNTGPIVAQPNHKLLLRHLNVGLAQHAIGVLGLRQTIVGRGGVAEAYPTSVVAETIPAGTSLDTIVTVPASAPLTAKYAVYETSRPSGTSVSGVQNGGMLTYITTVDTVPPIVSGLTVVPSLSNATVALTLSATASDALTGNSNVTAAEYRIDGGAATALAIATPAPTVALSTSIAPAVLSGLATGAHTIGVRAQDVAGNWSAFVTAGFTIDTAGPSVSGLSVTPNSVSAGTASVAITASASDVASGNSNITAAEYYVIASGGTPPAAGSGSAIGGVFNAPTASLSATIATASLTNGSYAIGVRARDAAGNWGVATTAPLTITAPDTVGPTTSAASLSPGLTNSAAVAIAASDVASGNSNIAAAEYFIGTVGANGSGTALSVSAVAPSASLTGSIPAAAVGALAAGVNTVSIHSRDAAGNWGAFTTATLTIDRTGPVVTGVTVTPASVVLGTASVAITASASDANGVVAAEYYIIPTGGTAPAAGSGTAFSGSFTSLSATVNTGGLAVGSYSVGVRARDAAGNWGSDANAALTVTAAPALFADSFATATLPGGWSSVGGTAARISSTAAANLVGVGTNGLAATFATVSGNAVSGFVQKNLAANATALSSRFYVNPANLTFGTGSGVIDILIARPGLTGNTVAYSVQLRRNGGQYQVRGVVTRSNGTTPSTAWYIVTGSTAIEVAWSQGTSTTFSLYTGGTLRETLTGINTNTVGSVQRVQLGPQGTLTGLSGTLYLDGFVATAGTYVGP